MPARCLSMHAGYRCRDSGECCSGVFAIPAEPHVVELVGRGQIRMPQAAPPLFARSSHAPESLFLAARPDGRCIFLEKPDGGGCAIHRQAGPGALPSACRHFPRVVLHDARGTFLSLSHFCPAAADLLLGASPLAIVDGDAALAIGGPIEPFDAGGALPPLLRPGLLTDLEGYDAWERAGVRTFARDDLTHAQALEAISRATEAVRTWKPDGPPLAKCVKVAFDDVDACAPAPDDSDDEARIALVNAAGLVQTGCAIQRPGVVEDHWKRHAAAAWPDFDRAIRRYLAAKLFGHRIAYECRGLRSIVEWLRISLAVLRHEAAGVTQAAGVPLNRGLFLDAVRGADLILVHRVDTAALARSLARIEHEP